MEHLSSRFIINILIPNIDTLLKNKYNSSDFAVSAFMENEDQFFDYNKFCELRLHNGKNIVNIELFFDGNINEHVENLISYIESNIYYTNVILNIILKINSKIELLRNTAVLQSAEKKVRIDFSICFDNLKENIYNFSFLLPFEFFKLFSHEIEYFNIELFQNELLKFFNNPLTFFPDINLLLYTLNKQEVQKLLYLLQKKKLLTPYQISLLLLAFPQHTVLINDNLSLNVKSDVRKFMKNTAISKRDLKMGIYSVEESIYHIMKSNDNFNFSFFIMQTQKWLKIFLNNQLIMQKNFTEWIDEMMSSEQLFNTLSLMKEDDIVKSISEDPDIYIKSFSNSLPQKRLQELLSLTVNKSFSIFERMESQAIFITNYKKMKIKKLNLGYESFPVLLAKIERDELIYLLLNVGWFIFSTALKNMNKKKILFLIDKLPSGAKFLITDVLNGIINPNIIHDEIQINKARLACVNEIISLYEDGFIGLLN